MARVVRFLAGRDVLTFQGRASLRWLLVRACFSGSAPPFATATGDVLNHWGPLVDSWSSDSGHFAVLCEMRSLRSVGDRGCGPWKVEASRGGGLLPFRLMDLMVIGSFVGGQPKKEWNDNYTQGPEGFWICTPRRKRGWCDGQTIGDTTTLILGSTVDAPTRLGLKTCACEICI